MKVTALMVIYLFLFYHFDLSYYKHKNCENCEKLKII